MNFFSDDSESSFTAADASAFCRLDANGTVVCSSNEGNHNKSSSSKSRHGQPFTRTSDDAAQFTHWLQQQLAMVTNALVNYWYNDLPPLYGPLRVAFYGFYWLITYRADWFFFHSRPTRDTFYYEHCVDHLAESIPHFGNLGFEYKREGGLFNYFFLEPGNEFLLKLDPHGTCSTLTWAFWSGLVLSCIGLGGKLPRYMVALSFWWLFGIRNAQFVGESSHSHYLAGMAMTALCFAENNLVDTWSVDHWIMKWYYEMQQQQQHQYSRILAITERYRSSDVGPSAGGAARKFVLYMSVCSIFFAGMHKFSTWGFKWMDGEALYSCLASEHSHWEFAHDIFYDNRFLVTLLAIATIIGEIGAFAVLLYPWWRPFGIASFYAFHIGVFALMQPNFISNEVTYLLIMDWRKLYGMLQRKNTSQRSLEVDLCCGYALVKQHRIQQPKLKSKKDGIDPRPPAPTFHAKQHPPVWKLGAWMYTILAVAVFITSVCRIDAFPFFSWALYNWHPSEPGDQTPFTQEIAEIAAHRCLTKPPFNPACQNHGTTRHHDLFPGGIDEYLQTVVITGIKEDFDPRSVTDSPCPLSIYVNWKPVACEQIDRLIPFQDHLINIMGAAATYHYDGRMKKPFKAPPLPASKVRRTLKRYAVDAAAAAIEDGPKCFREDAIWREIKAQTHDTLWSSDARSSNAVSRFSRQLRRHMNKPSNEGLYVGRGMQVLAVGVVFEYLRGYDKEGEQQFNLCMLGRSIVGENVTKESFGNHQVGASDTARLPPGDWSEVYNESLLIIMLGLANYMLPKLHPHFQSLKEKASNRSKLALWFGFFVLIVGVQIFWATSTTAKLIMGA